MDAEAYLRRIGHDGPREPSAATLAALQRAHLLTVPFDALDCRLGNPVTLDPADAYRKVVEQGRGGFCFELNGLFRWLLGELGYPVASLSARPFVGEGDLAPEHAHLALLVEADGRRWLVDVGFGFSFALEPLDLDERAEQERAGRRFRIAPEEGELAAEELGVAARRGYRFTPEPVAPEVFAERCRVFSTDPNASFVRHGTVVQTFPDGEVTVTREAMSGRRGGRSLDRPLADEADWIAELRRQFGLEVRGREVRGRAALPSERRTPPG